VKGAGRWPGGRAGEPANGGRNPKGFLPPFQAGAPGMGNN